MPWPQDAYVGQKVVCVDKCYDSVTKTTILPNEVVEIERIHASPMGISFEIKGRPSPENLLHYAGFAYCAFRPLQSTTRGMSTLTALLNPINHRNLDLLQPNDRVPEDA